MSFREELLKARGEKTDCFDIRVSTRRCFFFDFLNHPIRLWEGQGVLCTKDGNEWIGYIDASQTHHLKVPAVRDPRDGTSPSYRFQLPYIDKETYDGIKADKDLAAGRDVTCYRVLVKENEGLRPSTSLWFRYSLTIKGVEFKESVEKTEGSYTKLYSATAICRSQEEGRYQVPNGTYTDTAQQNIARRAGFSSDSGCSMVASNSRRTFLIE